MMNLGSLFSGGKDSTFAVHLVQKYGHKIECLLSVYPSSDESHLLHYPSVTWTKLQSKSMGIPQLVIHSDSDQVDSELAAMEKLLENAITQFHIEGIVHGGIKSRFQKEKFEALCSKMGLAVIAPLWEMPPEKYMYDLMNADFEFIITSVSSDGLDDRWLGKTISKSDVDALKTLSEKHGFNLNFEGGEAETFVINCPLFSNPITISKGKTIWDGYRGRFEIVDAELNYNA